MKKLITFAVLCIIFGFIGFMFYVDGEPQKYVQELPKAPEISDMQKGINEIRERSDFKVRMEKYAENEAKRIYLAEREAKLNADYAKQKAEIEKGKEEVRKSEVSLTSPLKQNE